MSFARRHAWAGFFALLATAILMLPAPLMKAERGFFQKHYPAAAKAWSDNGSFSMVDSFSMSEDNYCYAAKIRQAGTHAVPGDPYIRGNDSSRLAVRDGLTYWVFGLFFRALGDINRTWIVSQAVFTLLWIPLLYMILLAAGAARRQAVCVATGVTLFADLARYVVLQGDPLLAQLRQALQYAVWFLGSYQYFMGPTRITGPVFTYAAFFAAALLFAWAARRRGAASAAAAGLLGGLLVYVHTDVWTVYGGAGALYWAAVSWRKRKPDWRLALLLACAGLVAVPWVALNRGAAGDAELLGAVAGRHVAWGSWPFLVGAWLAWRFAGDTEMGLWLCCALVAVTIGRNSSLLVGFEFPGIPNWAIVGNVLLALVAGRALGGRKPADGRGWLWAAALLCALALPRAISYSAQHYYLYALPSDREDALRWLEKNTPKDSVVAALSPMTNLQIPVHTHDKTVSSFICPHLSDIGARENARRIDYALSLFGADPKRYWSTLNEPSDWGDELWRGVVDVPGRERGMWRVALFCNLPETRIEELILGARADRGGAAYPADYLWQGSFESALMAKRAPAAPAREVYRNAGVTIYKLGD